MVSSGSQPKNQVPVPILLIFDLKGEPTGYIGPKQQDSDSQVMSDVVLVENFWFSPPRGTRLSFLAEPAKISFSIQPVLWLLNSKVPGL